MAIELTIVTGFLGSGKTSLLRHLLDGGWPLGRVAVLIREFIDTAYDIHWLENTKIHVTVLDASPGQADKTIAEIREMVASGQFRRVILEVVDVSEAYELARVMQSDPVLSKEAFLGKLITVLDAKAYEHQLKNYPLQMEAQIAAADVILINKNDKLDDEGRMRMLRSVSRVNPDAEIQLSYMGQVLRGLILDPHPKGEGPRLLGMLDKGKSLPSVAAFIYRSYVVCYDRVLFAHKLLNLPVPVARFKGILRCWNRSWGLTGVPGQLDWDPSVESGNTCIAMVGLQEEHREIVKKTLDDELEAQQHHR